MTAGVYHIDDKLQRQPLAECEWKEAGDVSQEPERGQGRKRDMEVPRNQGTQRGGGVMEKESPYDKYRNPDPRCRYPFTPDPVGYCWSYAHHVDGTKKELTCDTCEFWRPQFKERPDEQV